MHHSDRFAHFVLYACMHIYIIRSFNLPTLLQTHAQTLDVPVQYCTKMHNACKAV